VGSFDCPECAFGLSDMSGNLWELTRSLYQPYPYDPGDDPEDLLADALWVMRGGHFADPENNVRAAVRGGVDPGARRPFIGFRVALSPFPAMAQEAVSFPTPDGGVVVYAAAYGEAGHPGGPPSDAQCQRRESEGSSRVARRAGM
jgi:hypothetical protein